MFHLHLEAVALNPHRAFKRALHTSETVGFKNKTNPSEREQERV